jgi:hypothetical protein
MLEGALRCAFKTHRSRSPVRGDRVHCFLCCHSPPPVRSQRPVMSPCAALSPATVRFIMGERKAVRASFDERSNHLEVTKVALTVSHPVRLY